jgi:hypothetical protein
MRLTALIVAIVLAAAGGCNKGQLGPTKEVQVPDGGPPVYTSAERAAKEAAEARRPQTVARASFEQPLEEPPRVRPADEWTEQETAADALGRIGAAAVPALVRELTNPDAGVRLKAVEVLGRIGPEAASAAPEVTQLLDDPDPAVRKAAAHTLGQIGPAAKDAVPALMRTLLQPPPRVQ